jgi:predicted GIY-YIG superfamily endonuclease
MAFFVYVLKNPDGRIYIGQTADLAFRLQQHNDPANKIYTHHKTISRSVGNCLFRRILL